MSSPTDADTERAFAAYLRAEVDGALMPIAAQLGYTREEYEAEVWPPMPEPVFVRCGPPLQMSVSAEQAAINAPLYAAIDRENEVARFREWLRALAESAP